jgi:SNW domain-containing protein 1
MRAKVEKQLAKKQKEEKEERLRDLALHARTDRAGIRPTGKLFIYRFKINVYFVFLFVLDKGDDQSAERDQIRQERQKERQRAAALQRAGGDKR